MPTKINLVEQGGVHIASPKKRQTDRRSVINPVGDNFVVFFGYEKKDRDTHYAKGNNWTHAIQLATKWIMNGKLPRNVTVA